MTFPIRLLAALPGLLVLATGGRAQSNVSVTGLGFFGNREMDRRLSFLSGAPESERRELRAVEIEDTAYILLQQLARDGYPTPVVRGILSFPDGETQTLSWTLPFENQFPDDTISAQLDAILFECVPGTLSHYRSVRVDGVQSLDEKAVQRFFVADGVLFTRKQDLAYTERNLNSRISHLLTKLQAGGFLNAQVVDRKINTDPKSGEVDVALRIDQGPEHRAGRIHTLVTGPDGAVQSSSTDAFSGDIFNADWLRKRRQELLNASYSQGFPDTRVKASQTIRQPEPDGPVFVDVTFAVEPGPEVTFAGMSFKPPDLIKDSILRRQVDLAVGHEFDILAVEEGRRNLLSLGVFDAVDITQQITGPGSRGVLYTMTPVPRSNLRLRAGWGSYEQARIGLRWEQVNLWQRGHRYELDLRQSMKSSNGDITYVIPHFFDQTITGYVRIGHEFREEISYDRTTSTFLFGATRRLTRPDIEVTAEYSLEKQDADRDGEASFASSDQATVSSLTLRGVVDERDSALYPTSGYDASLTSKIATEYLGGNSNFLKGELATSYHSYLGTAFYLHLSLRYGVIYSESPSSDLPFNERFFLGGENTIRGYTKGEASPRSPDGQLIGAETYLLANVELEQRILTNLSLVIFWDGLAQDEKFDALSGKSQLHSAGIGLRLRTPVGPIRIEYGHNIDPRPGDPDGTFHLSVGYPF